MSAELPAGVHVRARTTSSFSDERYPPTVGGLLRYRHATLDLAEGWIDMGRIPLRKELRHEKRPGELSLSVAPVRGGVTMDFAGLVAEQREWERQWNESLRAARLSAFLGPRRLLDVVSWEGASTYAVGWRTVTGPSAWPRYAGMGCRGQWRVSDGRYILNAIFSVSQEDAFQASLPECDAMMRSVRFEGPS